MTATTLNDGDLVDFEEKHYHFPIGAAVGVGGCRGP